MPHTTTMLSPSGNRKQGGEVKAEPGLDCRLGQIDEALTAAEAWLEANGAEVSAERLLSRDPWDAAYNQLQERAMAETRETVERLKTERERIRAEDQEFKGWCKEMRERGAWD